MSDSTEERIMSTIPDMGDEDSSGGSTGEVADSGSAQTSAAPTHGEGATTSAQPAGSSQQGSTDQQSQGAVRRRHDGLLEVPNQDNPATRDLVDPITGRTVAKGGIERKIYEDGQRHARENAHLKNQLGQLQRHVQSVNEVTQEAARLNVAPQDQVAAIRVMSDFLRDPVRTLSYLVEEVKSKGYHIPFLEQGVSAGMDMAALSRMIDQKMAPITQQQMAARQQQEMRASAERDLNAFLEDNSEANQNLDVLAEMLNAQPGLSLQSAYTKLIRWSHENGLDWTIPLKPQIVARHQQPTQQQPQPQRPIPGRGVSSATAAPMENGAVTQHSENASWSDIIRQSMREHGVNFT